MNMLVDHCAVNFLLTNFTHAQMHTMTKLFLWFVEEKKCKNGDVNACAFARSRVSMLCSVKSLKVHRETLFKILSS